MGRYVNVSYTPQSSAYCNPHYDTCRGTFDVTVDVPPTVGSGALGGVAQFSFYLPLLREALRRFMDDAPEAGQGFGVGWNEQQCVYPASVVKLVYAVAVERWMQRDLIPDCDELQRALRDMIGDSSTYWWSIFVGIRLCRARLARIE